MGDFESWCRFPLEMYGMWTSNYDSKKTGGKKHQGIEKKGLKLDFGYAIIPNCDILFLFLVPNKEWGPETIRRCKRHEQI